MPSPKASRSVMGSGRATAVVLTGGGARGAYEVGVLQFLFGPFLERVGRERLFDIMTGTSVGAVNACALAAVADRAREGVEALVSYWRSIQMDRVLCFGFREMARVPGLVLGRSGSFSVLRSGVRLPRPRAAPHPPVSGLLDVSPLVQEINEIIPWKELQANLRRGFVRGIALCVTEVCTSRAVVFYQTGLGGTYHPSRGLPREEKAVRIGAAHALASAAIPFVFPAVQIDGVCYLDGALRQNVPLSPAIRMGARRILVITLSPDPLTGYRIARIGCRRTPFPGSLFLLGRAAKVVLEGNLDQEMDRLHMFNDLIRDGGRSLGPGFLKTLDRVSRAHRNAYYRPIRVHPIRPSRSLDDLAIEAIREAPRELRMRGLPGRLVGRIVGTPLLVESELSSFLMFTPAFIAKAMRLGYEDARRQEEELARFFLDED